MTDKNSMKIDELIAQTGDPVVRGTLLVLQKIDVALDANTAATQKIADNLRSLDSLVQRHNEEYRVHQTNEDTKWASIEAGQSVAVKMTKVIASFSGLLLAAIIALGGFIVRDRVERDSQQDVLIASTRDVQSSIKERLVNLEARIGELERKVNQ